MHLLVSALLLTASAAASVLTPPVLPLIVRNPYLSTWLNDARAAPWEHWPMFWNGQELGFSVMAFVTDNQTVYPLLGRPHDFLTDSSSFHVSLPKYQGSSFDSSVTNLTYELHSTEEVGAPTKVTLSFISPITPFSTLRQSLPAAYLAVYIEGSSDVNLYVDVDGRWVSGDENSKIRWSLVGSPSSSSTGVGETGTKSWAVRRENEDLYTENNDRSEWGSLRFTGPSDASHQSGSASSLRRHFARHGCLSDEEDDNFRRINDDAPTVAFSKRIRVQNGSRSGHPEPVLFTVALVQDPVIQFAAARGLTHLRPLWASDYASADDMIDHHYADFQVALSLARNYSQQLEKDASSSTSGYYADIVALSARQIMGATQFAGTDTEPLLFMKEISSSGNVQTVDVIFPSFPFFLYTNPLWLKYILDPLLEHQQSGQYPNDYSMHDVGAHWPNGTGHADGRDEYMPVEECGDMLIMGLALIHALQDARHPALASGHQWDQSGPQEASIRNFQAAANAWATKYYRLWSQWTGYLVRESLVPKYQLSTDDFAGELANQTNLALKGIIGIKAMAEIASLVGEDKDAQFYDKTAESYIDKWQDYGISRDGTHAKLAYTWYGSWSTLYNLYADALLCFRVQTGGNVPSGNDQKPLHSERKKKHFVPDRVYQMQDRWYRAVLQRYGLPLDSRHLYSKSDWEFFASAVASRRTRNAIIDSVALWVNETITDRPFTDLYDTEGDGDFSPIRFMARPVAGGHFALLALEQACGGRAMSGLADLGLEDIGDIDVDAVLAADTADKLDEAGSAEL